MPKIGHKAKSNSPDCSGNSIPKDKPKGIAPLDIDYRLTNKVRAGGQAVQPGYDFIQHNAETTVQVPASRSVYQRNKTRQPGLFSAYSSGGTSL
jgi:hypothetical protein